MVLGDNGTRQDLGDCAEVEESTPTPEAAAEMAARLAEMARAELPLTEALQAAGVKVESVWGLGPDSGEARALPVLMEHLERGGYPDLTTNRIGQALATRAAEPFWDRLRAIFLNPRSPAEQEAAAIALASAAGPKQFHDLIEFVNMEEKGEDRIYFLRPIRRLGRDRAIPFLEGLRGHPTLGVEATAILKRRGRSG